jgi:hypothetical protein
MDQSKNQDLEQTVKATIFAETRVVGIPFGATQLILKLDGNIVIQLIQILETMLKKEMEI